MFNAGGIGFFPVSAAAAASPEAFIPGGRLTLESGVPVSITDQTAKTSIFYTPFIHDKIPLYDGAAWSLIDFTETTLAVGTTTTTRPHDVFAFISAGSLALEHLVWTSDTARATALATQDGVLIKSGDATRRYLGTFRTVSTTTVEDSKAKRFLWNFYNRVGRGGMSATGATHSLTSAAGFQEWNAGTSAPRSEIVLGRTSSMSVGFQSTVDWPSATAIQTNMRLSVDGAGQDNTILSINWVLSTGGIGRMPLTTHDSQTLAEGYHIFSIWEINFSASTLTVAGGYTNFVVLG